MAATLDTTPADDGFAMPGEFEPHSGCWMLWPERPDNWRLSARPVQQAFASVATAIATSEPVSVGVSRRQYANARAMLPAAIRVVELASNDAWMRDVGPTFVRNAAGVIRGVHWQFNAWGGLQGGLYFPWDRDCDVAQKVLEIENRERYRAPFIMEGGALHTDGQGTVITTEECLLHANRNPGLDQGALEILMHEYLGASTIVWLGKGVPNDETDGHIDELMTFVKPGVVLLTWTDSKRDPLYAVCRDAYDRLSQSRDARSRRFTIHKLPQPAPVLITKQEAAGIDASAGTFPRRAGDRMPGSYANLYIGNSVVVMPLLDRRYDRKVAVQLAKLFPRRRIVGVQAREILLGGGGIHCITQQVPAALTAKAGRIGAARATSDASPSR
ncbi:MAG TPA: agmatine deiminase [Steroidobacteraceae bacterium]|nr:agmatine deiminase [Steroidobacteraceae bacterium]